MITQDRLRDLLHYDPSTGDWRWRVTRGGREAGTIAGQRTSRRSQIRVDRRLYLNHRLAFLYMAGAWPPHEVDHRDGDPTNNRWANLRLANDTENACNVGLRKDNKSGFKGVHWHKAAGKWAADIRHEGKHTHLGLFDCPEDAHSVYRLNAALLHGDFACVE